jgi:hypothetical protein
LKFFKPYILGIFMEALPHRHHGFITQSLVSLPSPKDGGNPKFQASNHGLVFLLTKTSPRITPLERKMLQLSRNFQGTYNLCARNCVKDQILGEKKTSGICMAQKIPRTLGGLCQELRVQTNSYIHIHIYVTYM